MRQRKISRDECLIVIDVVPEAASICRDSRILVSWLAIIFLDGQIFHIFSPMILDFYVDVKPSFCVSGLIRSWAKVSNSIF